MPKYRKSKYINIKMQKGHGGIAGGYFFNLHVFLIFKQQAYTSYEIRYISHIKTKVNIVQNLSA